MNWYDRVPKVELHLHLEGAIPHDALWQLIVKYGGDPSVPDRLRWHVCPLHAITGIACPGCGATRAIQHLASADVAGALTLNPLVTLAILGTVVLAVLAIVAPATADRLLDLAGRAAHTRRGRMGIAILLVLQMVQGTLRA